jgi:hypothetical protein
MALEKIGFESQYEVYSAVRRLAACHPVVIDAEDLVARPEAIVRAYCSKVGIDFIPQSLTWRAGDRPEWLRSQRWHAEVASSTGFETAAGERAVDINQDPVLSNYLSYHLPYYEKLRSQRLIA